MTSIAAVIGWKFNHQPGMICRENEQGVVEIVEFPGGIPTQTEQDAWTAEYLARDINEERIGYAFPQTDLAQVIFEAFFEISNRIIALEGGTPITRAQLKDWLKAKLP